jgi:Domain of unknown function (DUF1840)
MLITFKSRAAPDVRMPKHLAGYLLGIAGKRPEERGVITVDQMEHVIALLENAIPEAKNNAIENNALHYAEHDHDHEPTAGLPQRAYPFLDMLKQAHEHGTDIIWGL